MLFRITQKSLSDLQGASFLDVLQQFRKEDIAVLYSGDDHGHSVIARKPLVTFSVADEFAAAQTTLHPAIAPSFPKLPDTLPLDQLDGLIRSTLPDGGTHPLATWIGQISYDIGRTVEKIPALTTNDLAWPMLHWRLFDEYLIFDHTTRNWTLIATTWPDRKESIDARLQEMAALLTHPRILASFDQPIVSTLHDAMPREEYLAKVQTIKDYIAAGDIYQANFAQRWEAHATANPMDIFLALMQQSPAPYSAFFTFGNRAVISASPELFLEKTGSQIVTRPIKGTRPRDVGDDVRDLAARDDLWRSEKDQAELAMIVDLLRNDLGRIARFGSVEVTQPRQLEKHPTVWHTVATIHAQLAEKKSWPDMLRALCPGGSITGAPKIRAMHIIEELESTRRGLYCGNIGTPDKLNIAIRTIQMINQTAYFHAGSGIVADSDPEAEYEECLHKAAALFRALGLK